MVAITTKPKKAAATCKTSVSADGVTITLPKVSSVALTRARDVCVSLAATAPIVGARARGIANALNGLIDDISRPIAIPADVEADDDLSEETHS